MEKVEVIKEKPKEINEINDETDDSKNLVRITKEKLSVGDNNNDSPPTQENDENPRTQEKVVSLEVSANHATPPENTSPKGDGLRKSKKNPEQIQKKSTEVIQKKNLSKNNNPFFLNNSNTTTYVVRGMSPIDALKAYQNYQLNPEPPEVLFNAYVQDMLDDM